MHLDLVYEKKDILELAKFMHDKYEHHAKKKGWNTQDSYKVSFDSLPDKNKQTMIKVAEEVLNYMASEVI